MGRIDGTGRTGGGSGGVEVVKGLCEAGLRVLIEDVERRVCMLLETDAEKHPHVSPSLARPLPAPSQSPPSPAAPPAPSLFLFLFLLFAFLFSFLFFFLFHKTQDHRLKSSPAASFIPPLRWRFR